MWAAGVVAFILLSGKRPFDADNDRELAKIIYKGQYSMAGPEWQAVSTPAKKFVQGLLQYEPSLRLSAAAALRTPFLQKNYSLAERQPDASTLHRIQQALIDSQKASQLQKFAMMVVAHQMPVEEIAELRAAFDAMDQNNHGTINYWEFQRALSQFQKLPHKELKRLFQELDQNHTGVINYSEFLAATLDTRRLVEQDILRSAFDKLDLDESGFVEPDELEQMLGDTTMDHHMLQEMFNQMDRDGDGRISYNEFRQAFDALQAEKLKQAQLS
jgi:calcium-dependent protein kinase